MITSVFKKSTPLNYASVAILMLLFFLLYQFTRLSPLNTIVLIVQKVLIFLLLIVTLFIANFVCKKNGFSKDSTYMIFFYSLYLLFFPSLFDTLKIVVTNVFLLLAFRRLLSLQSLKSTKEKIFDATLCILIASIFQPWCILFLILVYTAIIFHASNDYRNWLIPFFALLLVVIGFLVYHTFDPINIQDYWSNRFDTSFSLDYFTNDYQNLAFSLFMTVVLFFVVIMLLSYSNKPQLLRSSYKILFLYFTIAMTVFFISPNKSNDLLLFVFAPMAILGTNAIELYQQRLKQDLIFGVLILCSLFLFFSQL